MVAKVRFKVRVSGENGKAAVCIISHPIQITTIFRRRRKNNRSMQSLNAKEFPKRVIYEYPFR